MNENQFIQSSTKILDWLKEEYAQISTGRANPTLLDSVNVTVYGSMQPIKNIASINTEDPRTLRVSPWDKSQIKAIETAIRDARLPVSVSSDDMGIRVHVPALTEEGRMSLVKLLKEKLEQARVKVKLAREEAIKSLSSLGLSEDETKSAKEKIQKQVDKANEDLQEVFEKKQADIVKI